MQDPLQCHVQLCGTLVQQVWIKCRGFPNILKAGPACEDQDAFHCSPPSAAFVFSWAFNLVADVLESSSMGHAWLEASKASQDPEGSELPDPMTASCWISATRLSGNFDIPIDVRIWSG